MTRRRVNLLVNGLCSSSANSRKMFICSLNACVPFFRFKAQAKFLCCSNRVPHTCVTPLSLFPWNSIQCLDHLLVSFMFAFLVILANAVVNIICIATASVLLLGSVVDLEYLTCVLVIFQLLFKRIISPSISVTWEIETPLWFWKLSNHLLNVKTFSFSWSLVNLTQVITASLSLAFWKEDGDFINQTAPSCWYFTGQVIKTLILTHF